MLALNDLVASHAGAILPLGGLALGVLFGALVIATNFCVMGGLSDIAVMGDSRRFRAWILSAGVATLGAHATAAAGLVDLTRSMYLAPRLDWLGHTLGGVLFGLGMVLAGGCTSRNLARIGSGDLRALVIVIVVGISAHLALGGVLAPLRVALADATALDLAAYGLPTQGLDAVLAATTGLTSSLTIGLTVGGVMALASLASRRFRNSPPHVLSGIGIGLLVVAGWTLTGLAYDELAASPHPPRSLTFVRPVGDTLDWLQRATAVGWPGFGVTAVTGTILGAGLAASAKRRFRWQTFADAADAGRSLLGAVLMGVGGITALGCTIGQGVTGVSTLALGALLTALAITAGGLFGLRLLMRLHAS